VRFGRRRDTAEAADPFATFWEWWQREGRRLAEAGIGGGGFDRFVDAINPLVSAIDDDLQWELAKGQQSRHALIVTAGGVPALRRLAERWLRSGPGRDETWEYYAARRPDPAGLDQQLDFAGETLELAETRFELRIDDDRQKVDTEVFHPAFVRLAEETRRQIAFLVLDWSLGEDEVTRWIGEVSCTVAPTPSGVDVAALRATVEALAARNHDPTWALLTGSRDGHPVLASVSLPAKWIDHPLMDLHVTVELRFSAQTPEGYPAGGTLDQLRAAEDMLIDRFFPRALLVAHETSQGVRVLHLYGDSTDTGLAAEIVQVVAGWRPPATVEATPDPGWAAVRHLTG
jgi:hypothetical protein